jgi:hypothetical protein
LRPWLFGFTYRVAADHHRRPCHRLAYSRLRLARAQLAGALTRLRIARGVR